MGTPRTQRMTKTAMMTMTKIKRRHPHLVHAAALSLRRRARKNDHLLGRKRSPGPNPGSDPGRSQKRSRAPSRERDPDPGKRNALDPNPRSGKDRAQNLESGRKVDRGQSLGKGRKTGPS